MRRRLGLRMRGLGGATFALILLLLIKVSVAAQTQKLEQGWQFLPDKSDTLKLADLPNAQGWRAVRAGLQWNAQFEDLRDYMGVAWYRTTFQVPQSNSSRRVLVRFGAVDYFTEVYINGRSVGTHEGGYTPFSFDITDAVKPGANELVVRVIDPPMDEKENRVRFPDMLYNEIPHGKQNWYVQTGGIWQPVTLEIKPKLYIKDVRVTPKVDGNLSVSVATSEPFSVTLPLGRASGSLVFGGGGPSVKDLEVQVIDPSGTATKLQATGSDRDQAYFKTTIANPHLWSPDQPNLYTIEAKLLEDRFTDRFGFRSFEARDGKLYLNGEPYYMIAALDQDFYPETIYTPPSEEYVRDMMLKGKHLGINMLRCHIKVPDPVYLKVADEVGMLVWYEVPSWNDFNHFSPKAAERGEKIFAEQVARDWNHPSIVIQSIINESWGADLKQPEQRRWLRAAFERAKKLVAPLGRLVVDNSACCNNFHIKSDLDDFHQYFSIPDNHARWDKWVADFATRPKWSFSQHGDAARTGAEPLIISEFGNWGLPKLPDKLPWWFDRDFAGREVTRPAGVLDRFKQFKFDRLFRDFNQLAEESQWHQFLSLKHEIEEMRRYASIQGYVITEFTDINWEVNGLIDMWRNPKVYATELAKIQQPDLITARIPKRNYTSGEPIDIVTFVSHYSSKDLKDAQVKWSTKSGANGEGRITRAISRASVEPLAPITFVAPNVDRPQRERLHIEIRGRDGSLITENGYEFFIFPKATPAKETTIIFHDPAFSNTALAPALTYAGYKISRDINTANNRTLLIATILDEQVSRHLRSGGRAILLLNSKEGLPATGPLKVTPRAGSDLDGNWVTNFNWIRTDAAPFSNVAFTKLLGFESTSTVPQFIIQGVRGEDYDDVLAGIFYGWLNNNAALAVQMQAGEGKLFATTFRFGEYGSDPYATHLLDAIIRYTNGPGFAPKSSGQWIVGSGQ